MTEQEKDGLFNAAECWAKNDLQLADLRSFLEFAIKKVQEFRP